MLAVLKWLFYLIAAIAIIIVGGSFLLPAQAVVTRSIEIAAPPDKVFAIVGDLRRFNEFSPWADLDPDIKYTFEGPESGVGQKMNWTSDNADVGNGSMTAFLADSRAAVDAFHAAAMLYGGSDEGPPGIRPFHENFYGAYVRDHDGNKLSAVCEKPE